MIDLEIRFFRWHFRWRCKPRRETALARVRAPWWRQLVAWLPRRKPTVYCERCGCARGDIGQKLPRGTDRVCHGQYDFNMMDGKGTKIRVCDSFQLVRR